MSVTISMIVSKVFKTRGGGYDPQDVDQFLDEICDTLEAKDAEIERLRLQMKNQGAAMAPAQPQPAQPLNAPLFSKNEPQDLTAAKKLLEETQLACDRVMAEAKARADEILARAENAAQAGGERAL